MAIFVPQTAKNAKRVYSIPHIFHTQHDGGFIMSEYQSLTSKICGKCEICEVSVRQEQSVK